MDDLSSRLSELSRTPVLLVASDFDGTLSPIAPEPSLAKPNREAMVALHALAVLPQTHVAVISGRALRDLASLSGLSEEVHLVGSHGSEFDPGFARSLDPKLVDLRDRIKDELLAVAGTGSGFHVEEKPASVAFHYRLADDRAAEQAVHAILSRPAALPGVHIKRGKKVIELSVIPTDKGKALAAIRHRVGATAALFIGDDESDEDAFAILCGPDVGVRVGGGATKALFRVADSTEAARVLATLAELREDWLKGSEAVAIERHALLSDQRTVALVTPDARVVWLCVPRIDSASLFAELLGGPAAGFFAVRAADGSPPVRQSYVGSTFQLRTEWPGFAVTDYLDCSNGRPYQRAGRSDLIRVIEGTGRIEIEFAPRPDFGREPTRLRRLDEGLQVEGSLDPIVLRAPG
ncbi:MAG: trehalose-phosphatase, partial [Planctomycetota bacterium]